MYAHPVAASKSLSLHGTYARYTRGAATGVASWNLGLKKVGSDGSYSNMYQVEDD